MSNIKGFIVGIITVCIFNISCSKGFLEVNTQKDVTRQGYVKDLATLEHYHNGIYILLSRDYEDGIGAAYPELAADNLKPVTTGDYKALIPHYIWNQQSIASVETELDQNSVNSNGLWRGSGYAIIRLCNFELEEIGKYRSENPQKADKMKGEVLAIRAMIHFRLVNCFAQPYTFTNNASHPGIPYITFSDPTTGYSRNTVKEVYEKIIQDLNAAVDLLPPVVIDIRQMNYAAAKGLLAKVSLFKEDYIKAKQLSEELIQQYPLMTISNGYPDAVYDNRPISQTESLFQIAPIRISSSNASLFINTCLQYPAFLMFQPTQDIVDILMENPNDVRNKWVSSSGGTIIAKKFPVGLAVITPAISIKTNAYYPSIIRSSELVLTAAEASAKLNQEDIARDHLNSLRLRADNTILPVTATGPALLDSIYKERRKELCFEGWRLFDLQRWHAGVHRKDVHPDYPQAKDLNFPNNKAISPIPIEEVNVAGLLPNPGY
jgi:hypothetical protein